MSVLEPFETGSSWLLITLHQLLNQLGLTGLHGLAWWLAIILLVIVVRATLLPLALRQWRAQQQLAQLRPKIDEIRRRHEHNRTKQQEALAALFSEHRVSPLASVLPFIVQIPLVFALYRVLNALSHHDVIGVFATHPALAASASAATVFGVHLSSTLRSPGTGSPVWLSRLVIVAVVVVTALVTYLMQRHSAGNAIPVGEATASVHRAMQYLPTVSVAIFGCLVPFGVLVYWLTNTLFLYGQQRVFQRQTA